MKKVIVSAKIINDHFHDNDILFSVKNFSSFDFSGLLKGHNSGTLYAITARTTALFIYF